MIEQGHLNPPVGRSCVHRPDGDRVQMLSGVRLVESDERKSLCE
jgi:hypothetical protein